VPPPLSGDYTPLSDHIDLDESQMSYGTKSSTSGDSNSVSNDFVSCDNSDKSSEVNTNDFASSDSSVKSSEPKSNDSTSCASTSSVSTSESEAEIESNVRTPIQEPIITQYPNDFDGVGYPQREPNWDNATRVTQSNQFVPQAVLLRSGKVSIPTARPNQVSTGSPKPVPTVSTVKQNRPLPVHAGRRNSSSVTFGWWQSTARPMTHFPSPTSSYFQTYTSYVPQMYYNHMQYGGVRWATVVKPSAGYSWKTHRKGLYWVPKNNSGSHTTSWTTFSDPQGRPKKILILRLKMKGEFEMIAMRELTFFLGLQVQQRLDGIFINQDKYVQEILKKFDLECVRTATTPYEAPKPKSKNEPDSPVNVHLYRSMIGSLMYLTASRPDIMFAVSACSRFQVTPTTSNLEAVKKIFKYLKGQPRLGLWYPRESPFVLEAYSDSDYAGSNKDRKSTTGGCQFLGRRLISWQCKKQTIVATSSTEAEYVAAANCCGQVLWIQNQLLDYGYNFMNTKIFIDNQGTICIVKNPVFHQRTKHIEIRHHFIRDANDKKLIQVLKIHTDDNVADLLTKAFDGPRFNHLVVNIGMLNP
ncbi:putative ribonuclease H-like domain-containing protein, partial [Tanacetum coccineum]